jgi:hypothetical protein
MLVKLVFVVLLSSLVVLAQDSGTVPVLTDVQKLRLQGLAQRMEIATLKAQLAQRDFDAARQEISTLVSSLRVKGYVLDLSTLTYAPEPEPPPTKD